MSGSSSPGFSMVVKSPPTSTANALIRWYRANKRELPWRVGKGLPDPYHVLLSEFMLQQTQVATVVPYFQRFLSKYPTLAQLASADEQDVLRLWQGLGYYSRARNLLRAAKAVVLQHGGTVPRTVDALLKLPGIGRYTAGAIASLAFDVPAPILDGNVQRVLCRLNAIASDPRESEVRAKLWQIAEKMLPKRGSADVNSALMELGATVCTPRNPQCSSCPVSRYCMAAKSGKQASIPPAKRAIHRPTERRWVFCIEHAGKWLIEQRPSRGRWAGMWQFPTLPATSARPAPATLVAACPAHCLLTRKLGSIRHELTHRRYEFTAWACKAASSAAPQGLRWVTAAELLTYPMSRPQLGIASLAGLR